MPWVCSMKEVTLFGCPGVHDFTSTEHSLSEHRLCEALPGQHTFNTTSGLQALSPHKAASLNPHPAQQCRRPR